MWIKKFLISIMILDRYIDAMRTNDLTISGRRILFIIVDHKFDALRWVSARDMYKWVTSLYHRKTKATTKETGYICTGYIYSFVSTRSCNTWYNSQIITNAYPSTRNVFGARVLLVLWTLLLSHVCRAIRIREWYFNFLLLSRLIFNQRKAVFIHAQRGVDVDNLKNYNH